MSAVGRMRVTTFSLLTLLRRLQAAHAVPHDLLLGQRHQLVLHPPPDDHFLRRMPSHSCSHLPSSPPQAYTNCGTEDPIVAPDSPFASICANVDDLWFWIPSIIGAAINALGACVACSLRWKIMHTDKGGSTSSSLKFLSLSFIGQLLIVRASSPSPPHSTSGKKAMGEYFG